jgi:DNA-binding CsgD family transcriptional regulator
MPQCITCGSELHPDRAKKYNYCMSPECQEKNLKGLTMVAVGVNKSAEQYMILDDQTRDELAAGKFADQRRGLFGTSVPSSDPADPATATRPATAQPSRPQPAGQPTARPRPARQRPPAPRPATRQAPRPWTKSQERLALLYNEQGLRPEEIAQKLGLTRYTVTQIILSSRNRAKL